MVNNFELLEYGVKLKDLKLQVGEFSI